VSAPAGSVWRRKGLPLALLAAGLGILGVVAGRVELARSWEALGRVGIFGGASFLANIALTIGGPFVGWHLLMRSLGVPVSLRTTVVSGLLGRAVNLFSPFNYFGGESVRTLHVAAATGAPRRKILAAVVVSEVQVMAGLTVFVLVGLGIWAAAPSLAGARLPWAAAGAGALALVLVLVLGLALGDVKPCLRTLDALIRWGIFPQRLSALRAATLDLENLIRSLFTEHRTAFTASQLWSLSSPVAQFLRPTLFFWLLRRGGSPVPLPGFLELTIFFVLSQLIFMMPSTPGGVGVYEAGVVGLFRLLGWDPAEGVAYGLLLRLDDVVFLLAAMGAVATGALAPARTVAAAGPEAVPAREGEAQPTGAAAGRSGS
jgi:uncharacterized membrane protein YbhN (UPF0104 family)